jgi:lipoprotein-anchoring transpeptidase ErfK/SrfK
MGKSAAVWLNRIVRSRSSNSRPGSRRKWPSHLVLLLVLSGLLVAGGYWWGAHNPPVPEPISKPIPVAQPKPEVIQSKPAPVKPQPEPIKPVVPIPRPRPEPKVPLELPPAGVFPRPVQDVFEAQLALARHGISSGSLDGRIGPQTRSALRAFQKKENLPVTGELDVATQERLLLAAPAYTNLVVCANDLARLQPLSATWLGKSQQSALDYETLLELVAERGHAHPSLIRQLNPSIDWTNIVVGTMLQLPDVAYAETNGKAAFATISLSAKVLEAFDANTNLLAHFPCSIAQRVEKRPVGELHVAVIAPNPNYTFDPDVFPESAEARQIKSKLILPPGPNNPVGVAWIGLDKPGYGIHGTPSPEQVGRTESHGCFRLANWNAEYLLKLAWVGMPVYVEP